MSNICDTQYKVRGSRKALSDIWNTLQMMEVNSKDVYLYKLAEHYGIDYEHSGMSVRGKSTGQSSRMMRMEGCCRLIPKVHGLLATCSLMN